MFSGKNAVFVDTNIYQQKSFDFKNNKVIGEYKKIIEFANKQQICVVQL